MSSVGSYLQERRCARGVSLKEMARSTRVSERYLHALESDDFAELPAIPFTKGFIRAYCQILNEPSDEPLRLYSAGVGAAPPSAESARVAGPLERGGRGRDSILISLVLLVVLGAALFGLTLALQGRARLATSIGERRSAIRPAASSEPMAPLRAAPAEAPALPGAAAPPAGPSPIGSAVSLPMASRGSAYRLVARVKEKTWIRVRTEDGHVTEETMSPGDVREWVSNRQFVLTVGNAGGLTLELNGQLLPPLGPSGVVVPQIVIPPDQQ